MRVSLALLVRAERERVGWEDVLEMWRGPQLATPVKLALWEEW
jgi:hypothetical protein